MNESFHTPRSLWQATARAGFETAPLAGTMSADVAVIGAGFTGLSAALHLAEAGMKVIVLDKQGPGWGGSGRNGGQVNPGWKRGRASIEEEFGAERAAAIRQLSFDACDLVFELIERHRIDCAPVRQGYLLGALGESGLNAVRERHREANDDPMMELLDAAATRRLTGAEGYSGALLDRRGGSLQPLDYVRGLARAATAAGAVVFAPAAVTEVRRAGTTWQAVTEHGRVDADYLLHGANGYADRVPARVRRTVVPVVSCQIASAPLPPDLLERILPEGHHVSDSRAIGVYYRRSPDGRFVIGGRGQALGGQSEAVNRAMLRREALRLYPFLGDINWPFCWHGYVAMTGNKLPHLLRLGDNAYAGLGFNGRGVAMATMMGRILADCVAGAAVPLPLVEPKPVRFHAFSPLGVAAYVTWGRFRDRLTG